MNTDVNLSFLSGSHNYFRIASFLGVQLARKQQDDVLPPGGTALITWKKCRERPRSLSGADKRTAVRVAVTLPWALWSAGSPVDLSVHQAVLLNLTSMATGPLHPEKCGWSEFQFPETPAGCAHSGPAEAEAWAANHGSVLLAQRRRRQDRSRGLGLRSPAPSCASAMTEGVLLGACRGQIQIFISLQPRTAK